MYHIIPCSIRYHTVYCTDLDYAQSDRAKLFHDILHLTVPCRIVYLTIPYAQEGQAIDRGGSEQVAEGG